MWQLRGWEMGCKDEGMGYPWDARLREGLLQNKCRDPLGFGRWAREGGTEKRELIYSSTKCAPSACCTTRALPATGDAVMSKTDAVPVLTGLVCWWQSPTR